MVKNVMTYVMYHGIAKIIGIIFLRHTTLPYCSVIGNEARMHHRAAVIQSPVYEFWLD